jgi:hypothetical protein
MREFWFERTTAAVLRDAFRVETQIPDAQTQSSSADRTTQLPAWLYKETGRSTHFSRYDLRKTTEGASL